MSKILELCKKCKYCGNDFRSSNRRRTYCSDECFEQSIKDRQKKYGKDNKKEIYGRRTTCKYCDKKFKMEELKERCCNNKDCIEAKKREKNKLYKKKYYNKNIKKTTKLFKKRILEKNRTYRKTHKEIVNKRHSLIAKEKRQWVEEIKKKYKCSKCNEDRWVCLEFHHKNPKDKKFTVAESISKGYGKKSILAEIEKCIVLCSNCHQHFHYLKRNVEEWKPTKEWLNNKDIFK